MPDDAKSQPVRLPAKYDRPDGLGIAGLLRHHGVPVEFVPARGIPAEFALEPARHSDLIEFERAVAEFEIQQLADDLGYAMTVQTGGMIVLEPPRDPEHERRFHAAIDALFDDPKPAPGTVRQDDPWLCAYCEQRSVHMLTGSSWPIYVCHQHAPGVR